MQYRTDCARLYHDSEFPNSKYDHRASLNILLRPCCLVHVLVQTDSDELFETIATASKGTVYVSAQLVSQFVFRKMHVK